MNWILFAVGGALAASLGTIFAKIGLLKQIDSNVLTTVRGLVMAALLVLFTLSLGKFDIESVKSFDTRTCFFVIASGAMGALSWLLFFYALSIGPAAGVTAVDKLSIVLTILLAFILLGEKITVASGIGALLIGAGVVLVAIPWSSIKGLFGL
jgi:bacterial/archaeal transporter family protein